MDCKQSSNSNVCNACTYDILSKEFVQGKSIVAISKIAVKILWVQEFDASYSVAGDKYSVTIKCNGNITVRDENGNDTNLHIFAAQYAYCKLIKNWYDYYTSYKGYDSYSYIKQKLKYITNLHYITKIRTEALSITKYLEEVLVCNGVCNTIVLDKEVGKCKVPFSDMKAIGRLNSTGLVSILNTILDNIKDISFSNLTIDINNTYITCSGVVISHSNYIKCKSTVADMESIYVHYLSSWCSINYNKQTEVAKIKESISRMYQTKNVQEIYELSSDLLDSLW